ncbi:hypothetical protein PENSTE_c021G04757 [Penicillium steckii]|uniref:Uncharacterized protein n=1 Tax=Penicillium steckii TaxID=303698 RepID=A0A1V6STK1_9EURO|nr:hypothetical protein PENSTE_c021G04757 [Penicillium steckii]
MGEATTHWKPEKEPVVTLLKPKTTWHGGDSFTKCLELIGACYHFIMDQIMEQCELPPGDACGFEVDDLGLTLSPGSQSQLLENQSSADPAALDLTNISDFDFDILGSFDALTDFDPLVHQIEIPNLVTTGKRPLDETDNDIETPPPKRTCQSPASPSPESLARQTQSRMEAASKSSIPASSGLTCREPASTSAISRFALGPSEVARYTAPISSASTVFSSPYTRLEYSPSAPYLHSRTSHVEVADSTIWDRLKTSQRRINVLVAERNRYRDRLLSHFQPNPRTGKLKIDEMEAELTTLRRVTSTQQTRTKNLKAESMTWQQRYIDLARTHNSLVADYNASRDSIRMSSPHSRAEDAASGTDVWKAKHNKLFTEYQSLISALKAPGADPMEILNGIASHVNNNDRASANYPSPTSISSLSNYSRELSVASNVPSPASNHVPASGSGLPPMNIPGSNRTNPLTLDQDETTNMSNPPSGINTPAPSSIGHEAVSHTERMNTPGNSVIQDGATSTLPSDTVQSASGDAIPSHNNICNQLSPCHCSPAVPPQDVMVIDLTDDGAETVSTPGLQLIEFNPTTEPKLTDFRHALRTKKLDWLRTPPANKFALAGTIAKNIAAGDSPLSRPRGLVAPCPGLNLKGGKSKDESKVARSGTKSATKTPQARTQKARQNTRANAELNHRRASRIPNDMQPSYTRISIPDASVDTCVGAHSSGGACQYIEAKEVNSDTATYQTGLDEEDYHPDDDQLARMMEEELAK